MKKLLKVLSIVLLIAITSGIIIFVLRFAETKNRAQILAAKADILAREKEELLKEKQEEEVGAQGEVGRLVEPPSHFASAPDS